MLPKCIHACGNQEMHKAMQKFLISFISEACDPCIEHCACALANQNPCGGRDILEAARSESISVHDHQRKSYMNQMHRMVVPTVEPMMLWIPPSAFVWKR